MPIDIKLLRADQGGDPELVRESQRKRFARVEIVDDDDVPENYVDPIMSLVFVDPVVAGDGMTYERSSIARWLKDHDESPQTRQKITPQVFDNHSLRSEMQRWFERRTTARRRTSSGAACTTTRCCSASTGTRPSAAWRWPATARTS